MGRCAVRLSPAQCSAPRPPPASWAVCCDNWRSPGAALATLLFALHPVAVESVAWISEQKNTLSAVLYFLAASAYLRFADNRRGSTYGWATALFVSALLTKMVTATLPAALLVLQWWRHGRLLWRADWVPLLPWLGLGAAAGALTAGLERTLIGAQGADFDLGAMERLLLAGRALWFYLLKLGWPAGASRLFSRNGISTQRGGSGWARGEVHPGWRRVLPSPMVQLDTPSSPR